MYQMCGWKENLQLLRWQNWGSDYGIITRRSPAMVSAYDYYPFGMLMPDRYVSDTSSKCMTVSQTKWVTQVTETYYPAVPWTWAVSAAQGGTATTVGSDVQINIPSSQSIASFDLPVVAGIPGHLVQVVLENSSTYPNNAILVTLTEVVNGQTVELGSTAFNGGTGAFIGQNFTPQTNLIKVNFVWNGTPYKINLKSIWIRKPQLQEQTMLVDICSNVKDRYRFGFNGQEKVNEWAGIGNFMDYGARGYDSRIARFIGRDPKKLEDSQ